MVKTYEAQVKELENIIDKFEEPKCIDRIWTTKGGFYVRILEYSNGSRTFQLCSDGISETPDIVSEFKIEQHNLERLSK